MKSKIHGAVTAGHEKTAEAAIIAFDAGGNAFDAAVAALLASFVAEPLMSSAAGGGFMTGYSADHKPMVFDFFCQTPSGKRPIDEIDFYPIQVQFGATEETFHIGMGSMAVPGNMAGVFKIHEEMGSIPLEILAEPALKMAKEGILVNNFQNYEFKLLEPIISVPENAKRIFYREGKIIEKNTKFQMPHFVDLLEVLLIEGKTLFYQGEVAQKVVADNESSGGFLSLQDFKNYHVIIRDPLSIQHNDNHIYTNPPPSTGGALIALCFQLLAQTKKLYKAESQEALLQLIQILRQVEKVRFDEEKFLGFQKSLNYGINVESNLGSSNLGSTTNVSIMDSLGNALAVTVSNGQGAGYMIPETDVMMNNMLGEGALFPNGFHSWQPDSRVSSLMSPTVLTGEAGPEAVLGTGGAGRIPFSIVQVLHNIIDHKLDYDAAIENSRVYLEKGVLNVEPGYGEMENLPPGISEIIRWEKPDMFFGGVNTVAKTGNELKGIADHRREGVVMYTA